MMVMHSNFENSVNEILFLICDCYLAQKPVTCIPGPAAMLSLTYHFFVNQIGKNLCIILSLLLVR